LAKQAFSKLDHAILAGTSFETGVTERALRAFSTTSARHLDEVRGSDTTDGACSQNISPTKMHDTVKSCWL
jgi:hypothetical protein